MLRSASILISCVTLYCTPCVDAQEAREMRVFSLGFLHQHERHWGSLPGLPFLREGHGGGFPFGLDGEDRSLAASQVRDVITNLIATDSWNNSRNTIKVLQRQLVVVQKPEVLARIGTFLSTLEARLSRPRRVEVALVPPDALDRAAPGWRRAGAAPWLADEALARAVQESGGRAFYASCLIVDGRPCRVFPRRTARHLVDYTVGCTGIVPEFRPWADSVRHGPFFSVRVVPAPSEKWLQVEVRLGRIADLSVREERELPGGTLELLLWKQSDVGTTARTSPGRTTLLGSFTSVAAPGIKERDPVAAPFVGLLRLGEAVGSPVATSNGAGALAVVDLRTLIEPASGFDYTPPPDFEMEPAITFDDGSAEGGDTATVSVEELGQHLSELLGEGAESEGLWGFSGGFLFLKGERQDLVAKALARFDRLARERSRTVRVDLWQRDVAADEIQKSTVLESSWLEKLDAAVGLRATIVGRANTPMGLAAVTKRGTLVDVENVSGGTGHLLIEVSDPQVLNVGAGFTLGVRAHPVPGTPWVRLNVRGEYAGTPVLRQAKTLLTLQKEYSEQAVRGIADWVPVDLTAQERDVWEHQVTVPAGRPVVLSALPSPDGPGMTRVLIGVASAFQIKAEEQLQPVSHSKTNTSVGSTGKRPKRSP